MGKITMAIVLVAAFFHAVWLVLRRREPDCARASGARAAFLLMTVFFMGWLGAPLRGAETTRAGGGAVNAVSASENMGFSEAMLTAWAGLLIMHGGSWIHVQADGVDRNELRSLGETAKKYSADFDAVYPVTDERYPDPDERKEAWRKLGYAKKMRDAAYQDMNVLRTKMLRTVYPSPPSADLTLFLRAVEERVDAGRLSARAGDSCGAPMRCCWNMSNTISPPPPVIPCLRVTFASGTR